MRFGIKLVARILNGMYKIGLQALVDLNTLWYILCWLGLFLVTMRNSTLSQLEKELLVNTI